MRAFSADLSTGLSATPDSMGSAAQCSPQYSSELSSERHRNCSSAAAQQGTPVHLRRGQPVTPASGHRRASSSDETAMRWLQEQNESLHRDVSLGKEQCQSLQDEVADLKQELSEKDREMKTQARLSQQRMQQHFGDSDSDTVTEYEDEIRLLREQIVTFKSFMEHEGLQLTSRAATSPQSLLQSGKDKHIEQLEDKVSVLETDLIATKVSNATLQCDKQGLQLEVKGLRKQLELAESQVKSKARSWLQR